jgi:hypothetical protein
MTLRLKKANFGKQPKCKNYAQTEIYPSNAVSQDVFS